MEKDKQAEPAPRKVFTQVRWGALAKTTSEGRNGYYMQTGVEIHDKAAARARCVRAADAENTPEVRITGLTSRGRPASGHVTIFGPAALRAVAMRLAESAGAPAPSNLTDFATAVLDKLLASAEPDEHPELRALARAYQVKVFQPWYRNHYRCRACDQSWDVEGDSSRDDECPKCRAAITPADSTDLSHYVDP